MKLQSILKDSDYKLTQFTQALIDELEKEVIEKPGKGKTSYKVSCVIRHKDINLTPEEIVRQLYLRILVQDYHYPVSRIQVEYPVSFGVEKKRADIAIMDKDRPETPYIIIELKKPKLKDGKEQLKSYCNATGAPMGVWTNGEQISYYHRKAPNYFEDIPRIPQATEKLSDVLTKRWTIADLIKHDKLLREHKSLKELILEMEDEVLANAGVDVFEELFKLIFTKLYDELEGGRHPKRHLEFRNDGDTESELKTKIQRLFDKARQRWEGVFADNTKIELTLSHLSICVASLQDVKLFNSNLDVVDEAFEYLINKTSKGEKGQYFTPRYVIDMCVKMLNPKEEETMIDTAAGSCGFPVHTIFHVWKQILAEEGIPQSHLFTSAEKPSRCKDYVHDKVFAIDFDEKAVRVGRTLNLIAGDGQTNVLHLNTLDYDRWYERVEEDELWRDTYSEGWKRLKRLRAEGDNRSFQFDVLMANPPFAGDIKESRILAKYDLGKKPDGKRQTAVGRDILFIERNLDFLKPGGRMAVVLPQGRFNNSSDKAIREFIAERCRILAVVGLHGNVFKPHTGTKTSVLFVQKWTDKKGICPPKDDYPIFFATMQKPSKDNSGEKIFVKQADGSPKLDAHGHLMVDHDLFNHEGLTQDGIAEAFMEFAKKEKLGFFDSSPFDEVKYCALLEGLEVSEVWWSKLERTLRIDSEFYAKENLLIEDFIRKRSCSKLTDLIKLGDGNHMSISEKFIEHGVPYYRGQDIHSFFIENASPICIDDATFNLPTMKRSHLKRGDVLLSIVGTIGKLGLVTTHDKATCSCKLAILRPLGINAEFLAIFLSCKYGNNQIRKFTRGAVQMGLILEDFDQLLIPYLDENFQTQIEHLVKLAHSKLEESKTTYATAENLLLEALGLKDFQPSQQNVNIKSFQESFLTSGRLDAEYYQPKYEEVEAKIKNYEFGSKKLGDICNLSDTNFLPQDKTIYSYIELADIGTSGEITGCTRDEGQNLPTRARRLVNEGNLIVSSIEGSLAKCALITKSYDKALCSTGFYVINSKQVNSETLLVIIKSKIMQEIMRKICSGTILTSMNKDEFLQIPIPLIDKTTQTQIADKIHTSFRLRQQSETLLELAKRAVEVAIETDEATAIEYLAQPA